MNELLQGIDIVSFFLGMILCMILDLFFAATNYIVRKTYKLIKEGEKKEKEDPTDEKFS